MLNWEKMYGNAWSNTLKLYGNMLRYGLSMLKWEKMDNNARGSACVNALKLW